VVLEPLNRLGRFSLPAAWNRGATPVLIDEQIPANTEAAPAHRHAASVARDRAAAPDDANAAMGMQRRDQLRWINVPQTLVIKIDAFLST
jgi:hypothetical protein